MLCIFADPQKTGSWFLYRIGCKTCNKIIFHIRRSIACLHQRVNYNWINCAFQEIFITGHNQLNLLSIFKKLRMYFANIALRITHERGWKNKCRFSALFIFISHYDTIVKAHQFRSNYIQEEAYLFLRRRFFQNNIILKMLALHPAHHVNMRQNFNISEFAFSFGIIRALSIFILIRRFFIHFLNRHNSLNSVLNLPRKRLSTTRSQIDEWRVSCFLGKLRHQFIRAIP